MEMQHELKLIALDAQDLGVVSAHLQDAVLKVSDIAYRPGKCGSRYYSTVSTGRVP